MDTVPVGARWPKHPYRGLDFYRESDALLFRERDDDIRECADILLGFGVKILLLQGSSGSGKSSFLRAGLIPRLKRDTRRNFFLNGGDGVIRCTSDPLPQIARALTAALASREKFAIAGGGAGEWDGEPLVEERLCREICGELDQPIDGSRERLAEVIVEALVGICRDLPGKLILVLDQAEEVLTRSPGDKAADATAAAFFRFLQNVYLRNVDARLVVALRTEYYGRFRDELPISDDRLGKRPRSGGIDAFLLRPLRDKAALLRVVEAPTLAVDAASLPVYDFSFEPGLAERIADELLQEFPHASVTPLLQIVCAALWDRLTPKNRVIAHGDYDALKRSRGIVRSYIERGIGAARPHGKAEIDQWHQLLYSLVSRQGGGTVVSLTEPVEELARRAQNFRIGGNIGDALSRLTRGAAPLLRGEPTDEPRFFSLKHDVLAVVLSRWFHEHSARLKAKKEEMARRRLMLAIGIPVTLAVVLGALFFGYERGQEALQARTKAVQITNRHAIRAPEGDFRRSLLLVLANLDAVAQPTSAYERITHGNEPVRADTLAALRDALRRSPWLAGRYSAAGLDPAGRRMALLTQDQSTLFVLALPAESGGPQVPQPKPYALPAPPAPASMIRPAAGFVSGLGAAALVNGYLYFWDERGERQECNIEAHLPPVVAAGSWIRAEFVAGRLQLSTNERRGRVSNLRVLRFAGADLRGCAAAMAAAETIRLPQRASSQPLPVFADRADGPQLLEYLEETADRPPNELAANLPVDPSLGDARKLVELDWVVGAADRSSAPIRVAVGQVGAARGIPERLHYTLAFDAAARASIVKFDGPDFYVYELAEKRPGIRPGHFVVSPRHVAVTNELPAAAWRLQTGRLPWLYPPLAAAKLGEHWRVAWLAPGGVWAVESSDRDPGTARPILDAPLIGEPDGVKLQFTADGEFLVLTASQGFRSAAMVRIWNLRPSRREWIDDPKTTETELRRAACRIVRADGLGGAIDDTDLDLFQIDRAYREPCPEPKGKQP
ncbi:MAG TPA: hypothetical protein VGF34_11915 [Stellaceae bacterium]|jgi:hypothetical protein